MGLFALPEGNANNPMPTLFGNALVALPSAAPGSNELFVLGNGFEFMSYAVTATGVDIQWHNALELPATPSFHRPSLLAADPAGGYVVAGSMDGLEAGFRSSHPATGLPTLALAAPVTSDSWSQATGTGPIQTLLNASGTVLYALTSTDVEAFPLVAPSVVGAPASFENQNLAFTSFAIDPSGEFIVALDSSLNQARAFQVGVANAWSPAATATIVPVGAPQPTATSPWSSPLLNPTAIAFNGGGPVCYIPDSGPQAYPARAAQVHAFRVDVTGLTAVANAKGNTAVSLPDAAESPDMTSIAVSK
jgi:hypothetical protein